MGYYTDWENTVRLPTLIEDDLAIPVKVGDVTTLYRLYPAIGYGGTKGIAVKVEESDLLGFMNVFLDATEADSQYIVEAKVIPTETYPIDKAPFRVNWAPNYDFVINDLSSHPGTLYNCIDDLRRSNGGTNKIGNSTPWSDGVSDSAANFCLVGSSPFDETPTLYDYLSTHPSVRFTSDKGQTWTEHSISGLPESGYNTYFYGTISDYCGVDMRGSDLKYYASVLVRYYSSDYGANCNYSVDIISADTPDGTWTSLAHSAILSELSSNRPDWYGDYGQNERYNIHGWGVSKSGQVLTAGVTLWWHGSNAGTDLDKLIYGILQSSNGGSSWSLTTIGEADEDEDGNPTTQTGVRIIQWKSHWPQADSTVYAYLRTTAVVGGAAGRYFVTNSSIADKTSDWGSYGWIGGPLALKDRVWISVYNASNSAQLQYSDDAGLSWTVKWTNSGMTGNKRTLFADQMDRIIQVRPDLPAGVDARMWDKNGDGSSWYFHADIACPFVYQSNIPHWWPWEGYTPS